MSFLSAPGWEWNLVLGGGGAADSSTVCGCGHQCCLPACIKLLWGGLIRIRGFYPSSAFSLQRLDDSGKC